MWFIFSFFFFFRSSKFLHQAQCRSENLYSLAGELWRYTSFSNWYFFLNLKFFLIAKKINLLLVKVEKFWIGFNRSNVVPFITSSRPIDIMFQMRCLLIPTMAHYHWSTIRHVDQIMLQYFYIRLKVVLLECE